ncbi:Hypothetical predicted protein [Paramuricea clavata]|uniref:Uncharacterized protein n=1 Tax=Paramuricea clavata TaxID=317549 RepID=A0A6S7K1Q7_PARCT|nr:Hypothetical predicted protein [Paramuricea clavata]
METNQNSENIQAGESSGAVVLNTNAKVLEVGGFPCFDPKGDPNTLSIRWRRWKRAFNLYMVSKGVTNEQQKVALLLHSGGMELQELYYTLKPDSEDKYLQECLNALDAYFTPKVNVVFERHMFRQMQQKENETISM